MQDLSHLTTGLTAASSMAAGNTVSVNPPFTGPGSPSEAYDEISQVNDHPEPELGPVQNLTHSVAGTDAFASHTWTRLDANDGTAGDAGFVET